MNDATGDDRPRHATGRVRDVTRVPAADVPADYPHSVDGSHVLALTVERTDNDAEGELVGVYEAWPSGGHAGSRLARLLDAVGESTSNAGALEDAQVVLERRDGASGRHDGGPPNRPAWVAGAAVFGGAGALIYRRSRASASGLDPEGEARHNI